MKKTVIKIYGKLVTVLLVLLGFQTACSKMDPAPEYGVPTADYRITGRVTDAGSRKAIPKIQIVVSRHIKENKLYARHDTVYTDEEGFYKVAFKDYPDMAICVSAKDIDGPLNGGAFESDSKELSFKTFNRDTKGDGWYLGAFTTTVDFKLKQVETKQPDKR